jgi:NADH dehydrogenase
MIRILIVGGGFCGSLIAKNLERDEKIDVTLFDEKKYFEYSPGLIKLISSPNYYKKIKKKYENFLNKTKLVYEKVTKITPNFVVSQDKKYKFDILVISTGIDYPIFLNNNKNVFTIKSGNEVLRLNSEINKSKKIIIIGGGLIGTEAAGEIITKYPDKQLLIVHGADRLIERNSQFASAYAKNFLENKKVNIIFNQKILKHKNRTYYTEDGRQFDADMAIWSTGIQHNPNYMKEFNKDIFTKDNALNVNQFLQLKGYNNIFVGGDITGINEEKTAQNAKSHAFKIIKNIKKMVKNKELKPYKSHEIPLIISLGNYNALLTHPKFTIPGFIPAFLKLIVEKYNMIRL